MPSMILRSLSFEEIHGITAEIRSVPELWWQKHINTDHYRLHGALREGNTVYLRNQERHENTDAWKHFATVKNIVEEYSSNYRIGKCYLHWLAKNECISLHNDKPVVHKENIFKRFHIYLDIGSSVRVFFDNAYQDTSLLKNSILDFDATMLHSYKANNECLYFFVFDILDG